MPLFDEYTAVLERLSITRPLLLVVDDLQWADQGSIAMLWHLARRIEGMRVLVVCVYRPEEVTATPGDTPALLDVLRDLQARTPDCVVELTNEREFIDEFLDSEPNALDAEFRDRLFSYTGGHPLFTVELVRGMQERAEIGRDRGGVWRVRGSLDWNRLPSRVEAVIAHFILWIFGDMFTLLQEMTEPVTDTSILYIAPTTAIVLTLVVAFSILGQPVQVRLANLILAPIYLVLNIVFFVDATHGWEYYIGVFYVLFNVLIIWRAYTWPRAGQVGAA